MIENIRANIFKGAGWFRRFHILRRPRIEGLRWKTIDELVIYELRSCSPSL